MMKTKRFQLIASPFGTGIDERATQEAFVDFVGGWKRAEQLERIWKNTWSSPHPVGTMYWKPKSKIFADKAKREGFTEEEICAFMTL